MPELEKYKQFFASTGEEQTVSAITGEVQTISAGTGSSQAELYILFLRQLHNCQLTLINQREWMNNPLHRQALHLTSTKTSSGS